MASTASSPHVAACDTVTWPVLADATFCMTTALSLLDLWDVTQLGHSARNNTALLLEDRNRNHRF